MPSSNKYSVIKPIRYSHHQIEMILTYQEKWNCTRSEVVRRILEQRFYQDRDDEEEHLLDSELNSYWFEDEL